MWLLTGSHRVRVVAKHGVIIAGDRKELRYEDGCIPSTAGMKAGSGIVSCIVKDHAQNCDQGDYASPWGWKLDKQWVDKVAGTQPPTQRATWRNLQSAMPTRQHPSCQTISLLNRFRKRKICHSCWVTVMLIYAFRSSPVVHHKILMLNHILGTFFTFCDWSNVDIAVKWTEMIALLPKTSIGFALLFLFNRL